MPTQIQKTMRPMVIIQDWPQEKCSKCGSSLGLFIRKGNKITANRCDECLNRPNSIVFDKALELLRQSEKDARANEIVEQLEREEAVSPPDAN